MTLAHHRTVATALLAVFIAIASCVLFSSSAHAQIENGEMNEMLADLDAMESVLIDMMPAAQVGGGEVLGASTTVRSVEVLKEQLAKAEAARASSTARLVTLEASGNTATSTLRQIELLKTQRIPFYEARIASLTAQIAKLESGVVSIPVTDNKFNAQTFKLRMNGSAALTERNTAALIRWIDAGKADSATLVITKYGDGAEVLNTPVIPAEKIYKWENPAPGMYRATLTGIKAGVSVESKGILSVSDMRKTSDELVVKSSEEDPNAATLALEDDTKSEWQTIFAFELGTDDSKNRIELTRLPIAITTSLGTVGKVISDVQLVVGGEVYDAFTAGRDGKNRVYAFTFDGDEFVIEPAASATVEVQVEFLPLAPKFEGATIKASVNTKGIKAESTSALTAKKITGSARGESHTLRSEGTVIVAGDMEGTENINGEGIDDDEGTFTVKFEVTAFETDLFINKTAAAGTAQGSTGVNFLITNSSGTVKGTTTPTATLSSTADTVGGQFKVNEGETETFTLTVVYNPGTTGFYGVRLYSFNWNNTAGNPDTYQRALPAEDFVTDMLSI